MRTPLVQTFSDLPIERKLLLTSVIPFIALISLMVLTYRSVQLFAEHEDDLNRVYLTQRTAAEYLRLVVDMESGFRGFVVTRQDNFLEPYRFAHARILSVGDSLAFMVAGLPAQEALVQESQNLVKRLMVDKDALIEAVRSGHGSEAREYVEEGTGRAIMLKIRDRMKEFDRVEQAALNQALAAISGARTSMAMHIGGASIAAIAILVLALHLIARSITGPLVALAKSVRSITGTEIPEVVALERRDELGELTRVMRAMSQAMRTYVAKLRHSEADLRTVNEHLAASEARYRSIVDHAPLGIFTTTGMTMTFVNRYNRLLAGLDPHQEGDPEVIRQSIHPEDRDRVLSEFARAVEEDRPCETVFRFLHPDGTVRKVLSRRIPIRDEHGQTVMFQGFNVDITELERMQAQLSRAERLATLGQVAAGIAHEIRNPLVGIGSTAALLLDDGDPHDPRRADIEVILSETRRLDRIVNQIIDYARPREIAPMLFSLPEVLDEALKLLDAAITSKGITVTRSLHPLLPQLHADRDQLMQVFLNLIQNAVEAMGQDGQLTITASESRRACDAGLTIEITDTGRGIPPRDIAHVFEPFFTSGKHRGTGLGLAICRNIVEAHGGDIQVVSDGTHGAAARVWLPLRQHVRMTT